KFGKLPKHNQLGVMVAANRSHELFCLQALRPEGCNVNHGNHGAHFIGGKHKVYSAIHLIPKLFTRLDLSDRNFRTRTIPEWLQILEEVSSADTSQDTIRDTIHDTQLPEMIES